MFLFCSHVLGRVMIERLSDFPWVVVRIGCNLCHRKGQYRLARLVAKYGSEIGLEDLLEKLAADCPWRHRVRQRPPGKYHPQCHACFVDLMFNRPPPDLPPAMWRLRVVQGGRE
jgi:hypothetical protein